MSKLKCQVCSTALAMLHYSDITGRQWLLCSSHLGEYASLNWSKIAMIFACDTFLFSLKSKFKFESENLY